jgi:hypothetical protein
MSASGPRHDDRPETRERPTDDGPEGGSGTLGSTTEAQRQAGSYARDAEQDPALGRDRQSAE